MIRAVETLFGVTLLSPAYLLLALLVPAAILLRRRRPAPAVRFAPGALLFGAGPGADPEAPLPRTWRTRLLRVPPVLTVLGLLLVAVALARPARRDPVPVTTEGIEILLAIDVSSSMAATDLDPDRTRLDLAKAAAAEFIADRESDRIGLIAFARYPDLLCPPTLDHAALGELLVGVARVEADGPEDATGIGTAVARAAETLRGGEAASKVIILLTDGEENVATAGTPEEISPVHAGQYCAARGIRVYSIAVGRGRREPGGAWTPVDTSQIRDLARRTGGRFFEAREAGAVAGVYTEIDALETIDFAEPEYRYEDRFAAVLALAVLLLLAGRLLGSGVLP